MDLLSPKLPQRLAVVAALLAIAVHPAAAADPVVDVLIDQATLVRLERPAAEIVVGNPSIADVSVQSGKVLVVTGKSFGETNLIVMDADGKVFVNRRLVVQEPRTGFVTRVSGPGATDPALRAVLHAAAGHWRRPRLFRVGRQGDQDQAGDQPKLGRGLESGIAAARLTAARARSARSLRAAPYCAMRNSLKPCAMSWKIAAS